MSIERIDGARGHQPVRAPESAPERVKSSAGDRPVNAPKPADQDSISLSDRAQELRTALKAVQTAPDIREDRVAELSRRIAEGTYQVPSEVLAQDMLRGGF